MSIDRRAFLRSLLAVPLAPVAARLLPAALPSIARDSASGIAIRLVRQFDIASEQFVSRYDCLYVFHPAGWTWDDAWLYAGDEDYSLEQLVGLA